MTLMLHSIQRSYSIILPCNVCAIWNMWANFSNGHIDDSGLVSSSSSVDDKFSHFFIKQVSRSFSTNLSYWINNVPNFFIKISEKPLKSFITLLHKFFQQAVIVFGFNSSIVSLMNVTVSAVAKNFQYCVMSKLGPTSFANQIPGKCMWPWETK
jgi:hypothetical protein